MSINIKELIEKHKLSGVEQINAGIVATSLIHEYVNKAKIVPNYDQAEQIENSYYKFIKRSKKDLEGEESQTRTFVLPLEQNLNTLYLDIENIFEEKTSGRKLK
jgi:hypothetical protein